MRQFLAIVFVIAGVLTIHAQETEATIFAITNGQLIDGTGANPIENGTVIVEGERIVTVGVADDIEIPQNATIIDAEGGTILPGIINAHTHRATDAGMRYPAFTQRGVTTVCDMASDLRSLDNLSETTLSNGNFAGRAGRSGPFITVEGGYPGPVHGNSLNFNITDEVSPTDAVAALQETGATYIKIGLEPGRDNMPMLTPQQVQEIVDAAHARGMIVQAHVQTASNLEIVIDAGVDVLHHVPVPIDYLQQNIATLLMLQEDEAIELPEDLLTQLQRAIEADIILVPTLDVLIPEEEVNPLFQVYQRVTLAIAQHYIESGGRIAAGNDYGNPGVQSGMMVREMQLLQEAGLSPLEVITASTFHAAQVCHMVEDIGTLEPGKYADIIIVNGNPLDDLTLMDEVVFIMGNGTEIPVRQRRSR